MASTLYRRQSMAQLYEKLRAQDDDDDMAWLAQYSPDDKFDEPYVPRPPALSAVSSASPVSSCSSGSSLSDPVFDNDSSDDHFDSDSDSDVDPEPLSLDLPYTGFDPTPCSPLIFQSHDTTSVTERSDTPYIPSAQEISPQSRSTPSVQLDSSPSPILPRLPQAHRAPTLTLPSIPSRRTTRGTRQSSARHPPPVVRHDFNEDAYSESDGNGSGSEDEYVPSPTLGYRKRYRSTRSAPSAAVASPQKRSAENAPRKRARHSSQSRNAQTTPGITPPTPEAKYNPWACPYCQWVQRNHRTPDLKRHIRTHTRLRRPAQWVCCGVPVEDANNYKVPADAKSYVLGGETMIGGCRKEFSRRDALKRHLDNDHINCIGNFAAFASICEDDDDI
ncbi:hypothetical protein EV363DRAFT_1214339 [Boletus edulis]|nr:hypothetical protein EV363DRAFT_1214339 [Boletus edulis]